MYNIENREEINTFINNVFNYYNGRINRIIPSIIEINWCMLENSTNAGVTTTAKIVRIFPMVIARCVRNKNQLKSMLLVTIIHELYHVDQYIVPSRLEYDQEYVKSIEYPVEFMTWCYILNHEYEISQFIDFNFSIKGIMDFVNTYSSYPYRYHRTTYIDYLCCVIDDICRFYDNQFYDYVKSAIFDGFKSNKDIQIIINDNSIFIKKNNIYEDIKKVQIFLHNNYFANRCRGDVNMEIENRCDTIVINIKAKLYNIIAEPSNKRGGLYKYYYN